MKTIISTITHYKLTKEKLVLAHQRPRASAPLV
jgi:hypothetical protein